MHRYLENQYSEETAKELEKEALSAGWFSLFGTDNKKAERSMVFTLCLILTLVCVGMALKQNPHTENFLKVATLFYGYFLGKTMT